MILPTTALARSFLPAVLVGVSLLFPLPSAYAVESYGRKVQRVYGWTDSPKPVEALLQGVRYRIPQNYLDILEIDLDGSSSGFLAIAGLPDLQPRDPAGFMHWLRTPGFTHWATILVEVAPFDDIQRRFTNAYQTSGKAREPSSFVGMRVGLREYRPTGESLRRLILTTAWSRMTRSDNSSLLPALSNGRMHQSQSRSVARNFSQSTT